MLSDSSRKLDGLSRDLGPTAVDKSRSYYEARMTARTALIEAQHAAARLEFVLSVKSFTNLAGQ